MDKARRDIRALSLDELRRFFTSNGVLAFKGNQVYEWLWSKGSHDFKGMTNLSKSHRSLLEEHFVINHIEIDHLQRSADGTVKNAIRLHDGFLVESVLIPTDSRATACVSSQVGCSLNCHFCATSKMKRMRNLTLMRFMIRLLLPIDKVDYTIIVGSPTLCSWEWVNHS